MQNTCILGTTIKSVFVVSMHALTISLFFFFSLFFPGVGVGGGGGMQKRQLFKTKQAIIKSVKSSMPVWGNKEIHENYTKKWRPDELSCHIHFSSSVKSLQNIWNREAKKRRP